MIEYKDFLTCVVIKTEIPIKRVYEEQNSHRYEFCEKRETRIMLMGYDKY